MKGNNRSHKAFNDSLLFTHEQNFWHSKFWVGYNEMPQKTIELYDEETMQLRQVLPFPYFNVKDVKWNQEQSSLMVLDRSNDQCFTFKLV